MYKTRTGSPFQRRIFAPEKCTYLGRISRPFWRHDPHEIGDACSWGESRSRLDEEKRAARHPRRSQPLSVLRNSS